MMGDMTKLKRQVLPGEFYIVATPIGNLGDLSPRAVEVLRDCDGVYCEDTRITQNLFRALEIEPKRLERMDENMSEAVLESRVSKIFDTLERGESWAFVSDAGTPSISDPGSRLVARLRALDVVVIPIPGASALSAFLSASGLIGDTVIFRGFFPRDKSDAKEVIEALHQSPFSGSVVTVWYESPKRIIKTLEQFAEHAPDVLMCVSKELTKKFETSWFGPANQIVPEIKAHLNEIGELGEWVLGAQVKSPEVESEKTPWAIKALECLLEEGVSLGSASKKISQVFGVPKNMLYEKGLVIAHSKKIKES